MKGLDRLEAALPECGHWDGAERRYCRSIKDVHHHLIGHRCPIHTPAAMAGRPEPQPDPGWPTEHRAAQAAVATTRKDTTTA